MRNEARPAAAPRGERPRPGDIESFGVNAALVEDYLRRWAGPAWTHTDGFAEYVRLCRTAMQIPQASFCAMEAFTQDESLFDQWRRLDDTRGVADDSDHRFIESKVIGGHFQCGRSCDRHDGTLKGTKRFNVGRRNGH